MTRLGAAPTIITLLVLETFVAIEAWLAYRDRFLTAEQMTARGGRHGLPFIWHFGMWGDVLIVSPLVAIAMGIFWSEWQTRSLVLPLAIGSLLGLAFSWSYTLSSSFDAFVQQGRLTSSGWVHMFYMSLCLSALSQLFLFTAGVPGAFLKIAALLLIVHVLLGTHMVLGLVQRFAALPWYADHPLQSAVGWAVVTAVALAMAVRAYL